MKKFLLIVVPVLALMACQNEIPGLSNDEDSSVSVKEFTGIEQDIMINILSTRFGGYHKDQPATRAIQNFTITPYEEEGDTLMYVVQYADGWELYSANTSARMLLCSSDHGQFDLNDSMMPPAMQSYIMKYIEDLKELSKYEEVEIDSSWGHLAKETEMDNGTIMAHRNGPSRVVKYPDIPSGTWILLEKEIISSKTNVSDKLTVTNWEQDAPWNTYAKLVKYPDNSYDRALTGCVPVALGQYMYHTHYLCGIPSTTVDTATPINDMDYSFSGNNSEIWDKMAKQYSAINSGVNEVAIFLGYLGRELNADYNYNETKVDGNNLVNYINKIYDTTFSKSDVDYSYIRTSIEKGYPVIGRAYGETQTKSSQGQSGKHVFLIDQYREITTTTRYYYGLIRDPWPNDIDDPYDNNLVDENGNVEVWAYTKEVIGTSTTSEISMNWGYDFLFNYGYFSPYATTWNVGNIDFNKEHGIYKRSDI